MEKGITKVVTKAQIKKFRALLEAKAEEIRASLGSSKAAKALARGDEPADLEDLPVQSHEEWIFVNRNNIDVMLLREIEAALARMESDEYGTCPECEEPISMKRLHAIPWAHYCVPCQEELSEDSEAPFGPMSSYSH
ncbi:MAG: TraR/DksA family transcriptional regulator [Acidobacteria bacterium]|nr:TraR/DksA family transcriptional regulator [Acidobacteriota bacterium]